jgi:hypothetical protein
MPFTFEFQFPEESPEVDDNFALSTQSTNIIHATNCFPPTPKDLQFNVIGSKLLDKCATIFYSIQSDVIVGLVT